MGGDGVFYPFSLLISLFSLQDQERVILSNHVRTPVFVCFFKTEDNLFFLIPWLLNRKNHGLRLFFLSIHQLLQSLFFSCKPCKVRQSFLSLVCNRHRFGRPFNGLIGSWRNWWQGVQQRLIVRFLGIHVRNMKMFQEREVSNNCLLFWQSLTSQLSIQPSSITVKCKLWLGVLVTDQLSSQDICKRKDLVVFL